MGCGFVVLLICYVVVVCCFCVLFCFFCHLISSCLMFIIIGYLYDCYGLRLFIFLFVFFGFTFWSCLFFFICIFNIGFPFTLMFYVDFLCLFTFYMFICFNFFTFI